MSKQWEEQLTNILNSKNDVIDKRALILFVEAKQRTQLLKEVKEKVIGKVKSGYIVFTQSDEELVTNHTRRKLKEKQLKKLKELEEGKE